MFQKLEESSFSSSKCFLLLWNSWRQHVLFAYYSAFAGLLLVISVAVRNHCRPFVTFFVTAPLPSDFVEVEMEVCYVTVLPFPKTIWWWMKCEYGALVEWYWYGKPEVLLQKPVPSQLCPPQFPHRLTWDWTQASVVSGHWQMTWSMVCLVRLFIFLLFW
jgi:hypothetical protein